jgi:peptidoglycan/LPS O-acetylase OafA/YrhL
VGESVRRSSYRAGIDGLRALAVAAVLAFHLDRLPGGNLGVDAFFVVSGWLITWRLLNEVEATGSIALRRFWSARARRLMPASLAVIATVAVAWPLLGVEVASLRRDVMWAMGWVSNWGTITNGGDYWARFGEPSPLTHFWSLAIEEQFYLVWPLLLVGALRWTPGHRRRVTVGVLSATLASMSIVAMNVMFDPAAATSTYMNTFARSHSLLIGATAAAITSIRANGTLRGGRIARRLAPFALVGVVTIIGAASSTSTWLFRWGFPAFAIAMVVVVVAVADGGAQRVLAARPMRWLADRSYGLYLWHWPVFLILSPQRTRLDGVALDAVRVAVSVVIADCSLRLIESPVRRRRRLLSWRAPAMAATAMASILAIAVLTLAAPATNSAASVITLPPVVMAKVSPMAGDHADSLPALAPDAPTDSHPTRATPLPADPRPDAEPETAADERVASIAAPAGPIRVLVTGDSTAVQMADALLTFAAAHSDQIVAGSAAFPGCGMSAGNDGRQHLFTNSRRVREAIDLSGCLQQWDSIGSRVINEQIDVVLVQIGPWDTVDIAFTDGTTTSIADASWREHLAAAYAAFVAEIEALGAEVVWITPADANVGWGDFTDPVNEPARWTALRAIIDTLPVEQIDLHQWLITEALDGRDGRPDGIHLAPGLNTRFVEEQLVPALVA